MSGQAAPSPAEAPGSLTPAQVMSDTNLSKRVNGHNWSDRKKPFRPTAGLSSYEQRQAKKRELDLVKALEKEIKEEKEAKRQALVQKIKDRRQAKIERERFEQLAQKMHKKRVERLKRREKRNKMLHS